MDSNKNMNCNKHPPCSDELNEFSYENSLYEALEELRLKRRIEQENQNAIYDLLQQKYDQEKHIEEEKRKFQEEKRMLEEQINDFRKASEKKNCSLECDMKNQDMFKKMFECEINSLREELKAMHMVKLNLERKCQGFETEVKLHKSLKESAVQRINVLQQELKEVKIYQEQLNKIQSTSKENVQEAYSILDKYDITNRHLCEIISFLVKRNKFLSAELIKSQSKVKYIVAASERSSKDIKDNGQNGIENMQIYSFVEKVNTCHQGIFEILSDIRKTHQELVQTKTEKKNAETQVEIKNVETKVEIKNAETQVEIENVETQVEVENVETQVEIENIEKMETGEIPDLFSQEPEKEVETQPGDRVAEMKETENCDMIICEN